MGGEGPGAAGKRERRPAGRPGVRKRALGFGGSTRAYTIFWGGPKDSRTYDPKALF